MPINARVATTLYNDTRLDKFNASRFTVQVNNGSALYQVNVPPFGNGEAWMPAEGALLTPGLWTFDPADWGEYGTQYAQGIRFKLFSAVTPPTVTVS